MFKSPVPAKLPHLLTMLDNIGLPDKQVARFLSVSPSTVKRWRDAGQAPRPVMLALFWETSWGRSAVYCESENNARMQYMRAMSLELQVHELKAQIAQLQRELDKNTGGAANSPWFSKAPSPRTAAAD